MRLFGFDITAKRTGPLAPVDNRGGWHPIIREPYSGAWQRDEAWTTDSVLAYHAVFACISLIAADIGKLRIKLVQQDGGIWSETESPVFSPVLRRPNRYANHIQFKESWITSKLIHGNAYALKRRDSRGVVDALFLLSPSQVKPMVTPHGEIFYQLTADDLTGLVEPSVTVPASEIIHDRMNCLFHPLVGISPIYACGLAASHGLKMQEDSKAFFSNGANPGGLLTAPGAISDETAARLKAHWDANYSGAKSGKVAVMGDGLKFEPMRMTAVDAQVIEQMKWTAEIACSTFHVPAYMVGVGPTPSYNNVEALNQQYYSQCLQSLIESMELCLDEGLGLPRGMGTELDLDGLLRMDTASLYKSNNDAVGGGWMAPNEARRRVDLKPVKGGETPYLQQQNWSLAQLSERTPPADAPVTALEAKQ